MSKRMNMHRSLAIAGGILLAAGVAVAQDFPKVETAPGYMYTHTGELFGGTKALNCSGIGGTIAVNATSVFGVAADLGTCFPHGISDSYAVGSKASFTEQTYLFGPRLTFNRKGKVHPFLELSLGAVRARVKCDNGNVGNACGVLAVGSTPTTPGQLPTGTGTPTQLPAGTTLVAVKNPTATSVSKAAFGMAVGGGFDVQLNKKIALRLVQAEYMYSRFGNSCEFAVCSNNTSQNSFRLKSGIVMSWGAH